MSQDLQAVFDQAAVGLGLVDQTFVWRQVNPALAVLLGRAPADLLLRRLDSDVSDLDPGVAALVKGVIDGGQPVIARSVPLRSASRGDRTSWVVTVAPVRIGDGQVRAVALTVVVADAPTGEADREDRTSRELIQIIERSPSLIATTDLAGHFTFVNLSGRRLVGLGATEDPGTLHVTDVLAGTRRASFPEGIFVDPGNEGALMRDAVLVNVVSGRRTNLSLIVVALHDRQSRQVGYGLLGRDVTEKRRAIEDLAIARSRLNLFIERVPAGMAVYDTHMRFLAVSRRFLADFRFGDMNPAEVLGRSHYELFGDRLAVRREIHERVLSGETLGVAQHEIVWQDGSRDYTRWEMTPWRHDDGSVGGAVLSVEVITERVRAEHALIRNEQSFRAMFEQAAVGMALISLDGAVSRVNRKLCDIVGYGEHELLGRALRELISLDDVTGEADVAAELLAGPTGPYASERRVARRDGTLIWVNLTMSVARDETGEALHFIAVVEDISARKSIEAAQRELLDTVNLGAFMARELDGTIRFWSRGCETLYGWTAEEAIGQRAHELLNSVSSISLEDINAALEQIGTWIGDVRQRRRDGSELVVMTTNLLRRDIDGVAHVLEAVSDVTAQRDAEAALLESNTRFRALFEAMPQLAFIAYADGRFEFRNQRWGEFAGANAVVEGEGDLLSLVHPAERSALASAWSLALSSGETIAIEHRLRGAAGHYSWFLTRAIPVRGSDGVVTRWFGTSTDISQIVAAREATARSTTELEALVRDRTRALTEGAQELAAEISRRERAQAALVQSQKLEALGKLTSGITHDFNNVLAAIIGNLSLLSERIKTPDAARLLERTMRAAERGTKLIAQLMAFARKEDLRPEIVDLSATIRSIEDMVVQVVGRQIRCVFDLQGERRDVIIDPIRLETALLNLAANARDAMLEGGTITIGLNDAVPSQLPADLDPTRDYVVLSVTDTGAGMDEATLERATEPFYTTKEAGHGTGLGLPSVQALAVQSGGTLRLTSQLGQGTTVEVFLPWAAVTASRDGEGDLENAAGSWMDGHGHAVILVVDDDETVRPVIVGILRKLGYKVFDAASAESAEALAVVEPEIDLLLTDVVMPGASGNVLFRRLQATRPNLRVVYLTGLGGGARLGSAPVLVKPFTDAALARSVLEGLGRVSTEPSKSGPSARSSGADRILRRVRHPLLRDAFGRWAEYAGGAETIPRRDSLPPSAFSEAEREDMYFIEVQSGTMHFGEVGRRLEERAGRTLSGLRVSPRSDDLEIAEAIGEGAAVAYAKCATSRAPYYDYARFGLGDGRPILFERLLLPLTDDGETVSRIIGFAVFSGLPVIHAEPVSDDGNSSRERRTEH